MGKLRYGPARVPSRKSPAEAIRILKERKYTACEIDFESGFWMDYPWAEEFGKLARRHRIALSVHAPIAGFMGHVERDKKQRMAVGMLDHSAGIAKAAGAEVIVFHPGFLLGRERKAAIASVVEQLAELRERLEGKGRDVDFAHLHAVTDGAFTTVKAFHDVLKEANKVLARGAPFHIHFSDIAYANRNETKHLPYGEGSLRADPMAKALARFARPATVISESPNEESHQAIRSVLTRSPALRGGSASRVGSRVTARPASPRSSRAG